MYWLDLFAVQGTLKSLLQHHSSKASNLWRSYFFTVQLSHPYMTTGKTIALTRWNFVGKVMSLLLNMLFRLVITFLPKSKHLLISWLQSPSSVILELQKIKSDTVSTVSPSISAPSKMKYFWINLTKYMQDLFVENCKFPINEIKEEVNKWRAISIFLIRRFNVVKMSMLPKLK